MLGTVATRRRYPVKSQPVTLTATKPPAASLDRAVPEAVLRSGIYAQVPFQVSEIGAGSPRTTGSMRSCGSAANSPSA